MNPYIVSSFYHSFQISFWLISWQVELMYWWTIHLFTCSNWWWLQGLEINRRGSKCTGSGWYEVYLCCFLSDLWRSEKIWWSKGSKCLQRHSKSHVTVSWVCRLMYSCSSLRNMVYGWHFYLLNNVQVSIIACRLHRWKGGNCQWKISEVLLLCSFEGRWKVRWGMKE